MTGTDLIVLAGAVTLIVAVNWWFFVAGRTPAAVVAAANGAPAEVVIVVDGGYSPAAVQVKAGEKVRLVFDRRDTSSCSEEVVIPAFNVRQFLPSGARTVVEIGPLAAGTYPYTCGMSMLRGTIIANA
jgi:plastocyanin domain-containing protein